MTVGGTSTKRGLAEVPAVTAARRRTTPSPARTPVGYARDQDAINKDILRKMAAYEAKLAEMQQKLEEQTAATQQRDAQLNEAERVTHLLRNEALEAKRVATEEAAKTRAATAECDRTRHELSARLASVEQEASKAVQEILNKTEAEAEQRHHAAMQKAESTAQQVYDRDIEHLKTELGQALARTPGSASHAAPAAPCSQCPVKQARISSLESELAAAVAKTDDLNSKLFTLAAKHENDNNTHKEKIKRLETDLGHAQGVIGDLHNAKDAEVLRGNALLKEANDRHATREAELTDHAESLANELEKVKAQAAALHARADKDGGAALRSVQDELLVTKTNLINAQSLNERLDKQLNAIIAQLGNAQAQHNMIHKVAASTQSHQSAPSRASRDSRGPERHSIGDADD